MIHRQGGAFVVEFLVADLRDQAAINRIGRDLDDLIARSAAPRLVISFENVRHISLAVLRVLIRVHQKTAAAGGGLRLAAVPTSVLQVLRMVKVHKCVSIYPSTDQALVRF